MTTTKDTSRQSERSITFNRVMYGAFVMLGIYFIFVNKDTASAMSNLGIALIFDPFDQSVMWSKRPLYQRAWLVVHVSVILVLLVYLLLTGFR